MNNVEKEPNQRNSSKKIIKMEKIKKLKSNNQLETILELANQN